MAEGHSHQHAHAGAALSAGSRYRGRLAAALCVLLVLMVVEVVTAFVSNSLSLLSDAGHMLTDVVGLGMALAAVSLAARTGTRGRNTFGLYRLEILAVLANAVLLTGVALWVITEAVVRLSDPPEVLGGPMLVVAVAGLIANLVAFGLLREGARESINVKGAYLEVVADTLGSVGVILAAVVLEITGWRWVDPVVAVAIGVFIFPRTFSLGAQAVRILVQAAPPGTDLEAMQTELGSLTGVVDVHDLHVWTLTSDMEVATAHLMVSTGTDPHGVLDSARTLLAERYGIAHATLQVEPDDHEGCSEVAW